MQGSRDSPPAPRHDAPSTPTPLLRTAAILYVLFVAYACLVPFDFRAVGWEEAARRYETISHLRPGDFHRTDFAANVLLFLPLGFLVAGALGAGWRGVGAAWRSAAVVAGAVAFQALLEFVQVYTPPRLVSVWDVLAGGIGGAAGLGAWWVAAAPTRRALERWGLVHGSEGVAGWLLVPYLLFLVVWNVFPFDLTLDPATLSAKWSRGLIAPIPFTLLSGDWATALSSLIGEALLWVPVAGLLVLSGRSGRFVAWCATVLLAVAIEAVQALVESRVSDMTDVISAAAGAAAGAWLGWVLQGRRAAGAARTEADRSRVVWASLLAAVLWSLVLAVGFLYPFDFRHAPGDLARGLSSLTAVPLRAQWAGSEARALWDLLPQIALFAPFGAIAATLVPLAAGRIARWGAGAAGALAAGILALAIEGLQIFLPGKVPDSTDVVAAAAGAVLGFAGASAIRRALARPAGPRAAAAGAPDPSPPSRERRFPLALGIALAFGVLLLMALALARSPEVPYNVRELFSRGGAAAVLAFPLAVAVLFAPPALVAEWASRGRWQRAVGSVAGVVGHAVAVWFVLRAGVPGESILDVVGSAVLGWPGESELMARFVVLFGTISALYVTGAHLASAWLGPERARRGGVLARWCVCAAPLFATGHLVVVRWASTDNLTELMAGGGSLGSSLALGAALLAAAAATAALAAGLRRRGPLRLAALVLVAGWIVFWAGLDLGTAKAIEKYHRTFSATQFLFSADRDHYAPPRELLLRGALAYLLVVIAGAVAQGAAVAGFRAVRRSLPGAIPVRGSGAEPRRRAGS